MVAISNSCNQLMSGNVGSVKDVSSIVANVGVAVGIVSPFEFASQPKSISGMSTVSHPCETWSEMWE